MASIDPAWDPTALRRHRYFESRDLDETKDLISGILQPHALKPAMRARHLRSHMDFVRLSGIGMGTIGYNEEMHVDAGTIEDFYLIVLCLRGRAELYPHGQRVSVGGAQAMICSPGSSFSGLFSEDCEQFVLRIDEAAIQAYAGDRPLNLDCRIDLTRPSLRPWLAQLKMISSCEEMVTLAQTDRRVAIEIEHLLIGLLLAGQPDEPARKTDDHRIAPRAVRRAEAFIDSHAQEAISLADIAAAAGVPPRTLLDGFKKFRGKSPMQRVRETRLHHSRAMLSRGDPAVSVTMAAVDAGFGHLGRFSLAYRAEFGESPSETRARHLRFSFVGD